MGKCVCLLIYTLLHLLAVVIYDQDVVWHRVGQRAMKAPRAAAKVALPQFVERERKREREREEKKRKETYCQLS